MQHSRANQSVSGKLAKRNIKQTGPEGHAHPARHTTEWVTDQWQPGEQQNRRAKALCQTLGMCLPAAWRIGPPLHGPPDSHPHPVGNHPTQSISSGRYTNRKPHSRWRQRHVGQQCGLRPQRQQRGSKQTHQKDCTQPDLRQRQPVE